MPIGRLTSLIRRSDGGIAERHSLMIPVVNYGSASLPAVRARRRWAGAGRAQVSGND